MEQDTHPPAAVQFEEILNGFSQEQINELQDAINSHAEMFNNSGHRFSGLKNLYAITDKENESSISVASCRAGCAHCCSIRVVASELETDLIIHHCRQNDIAIDENKLQHLQDLEADEYMFSPHKRCTFLGEDNKCKIYEVRPFSCRNYFVTTPPEDCNTDVHPHGYVAGLMNWPASLPAVAVMQNYPTGNFAKLLLKSLNK